MCRVDTESWREIWPRDREVEQGLEAGLRAEPSVQHNWVWQGHGVSISSFPESRVYFLRVMNKQGQNVVIFMF